MSDLRAVARALGGEVVGLQVVAPGPGHSAKDRSMSVRLSPGAPDGFLAFSHAGDDWRACRDHVKACLGLSREKAPRGASEARRQATEPRREDDGHNAHKARALASAAAYVREMRPVRGTPGERYVCDSRRIDTDTIADVLERTDAIGWHPRVYFNQPGHPLHGQRLGCIVAVMTDPVTAKPTGAISRTYLDDNLRKIGKARSLGTGGGVVRLSRDEDVLEGIHVGEGLETALSAMALGLRPTWALGSKGEIAKFPVLPGVEALTILAEPDAGAEVEACASRWHAAGREVLINRPMIGKDLNDAIRGAP